MDDAQRVALVIELVAAGYADRVILSGNAIGVAKGLPDSETTFSGVLASFVPMLRSQGLGESDVRRILVDNPRELLTVRVQTGGE